MNLLFHRNRQLDLFGVTDNKVDHYEDLDEVLQKAGLDWEVKLHDLYFHDEGKVTAIRDRALVRHPGNVFLDVVGPKYKPVQNIQLMEFLKDYLECGDATIDYAGSFDNGRWVWVLAKLNERFDLGDGDVIDGYILIANPHMYARGLTVKVTSVRVVCSNTLTFPLMSGERGIRIRHVKEFNEEVMNKAKRTIGIARDQFMSYRAQLAMLCDTPITLESAILAWSDILGVNHSQRESPVIRRLIELFEGEGLGASMSTARNTAWGALNAVTQWVDHERGRKPENRLREAWIGSGERLKARAFNRFIEM